MRIETEPNRENPEPFQPYNLRACFTNMTAYHILIRGSIKAYDIHFVDRFHDAPSSYSSPGRDGRGPVHEPRIETVKVDDLLVPPGRKSRPSQIVVILRGLPGAGKTYVGKLIKVLLSLYCMVLRKRWTSQIVVILRGLPGAGKTYVGKLIKVWLFVYCTAAEEILTLSSCRFTAWSTRYRKTCAGKLSKVSLYPYNTLWRLYCKASVQFITSP